MSDVSNLSKEQRDALAARALEDRNKARNRAAAYRQRKGEKGLVQVSVWVPEDRRDDLRKLFQDHADKVRIQDQAEKKSPPKDQAGAGQSAATVAAKTQQNPEPSQPAQTKPEQ